LSLPTLADELRSLAVLELGLALQLRIAQTRRLKATAYGGGEGWLPKFGEVTELVSGSL
jgi:hypothetical protein